MERVRDTDFDQLLMQSTGLGRECSVLEDSLQRPGALPTPGRRFLHPGFAVKYIPPSVHLE